MTIRGPSPQGGWNHNNHYHDRLLALVPRPCRRALDVGCGLGGFAAKLAVVADDVDAIDGAPSIAAEARERCACHRNVRVIAADFMQWTPEHHYDFVAMIASLHHLPFAAALRRATDALEPGGVLAVLGLDRSPSWIDTLAQAALAVPVSRYYRLARPAEEMGAPIVDPRMTLAEIRRDAGRLLPGAIVRRHVLWRYSLVWTKPREMSVTASR